ncbi:MAG: RNA methyltransferase [Clostridia bacterium]|nr:RNA methyltransferase [Clostridia bacterium]
MEGERAVSEVPVETGAVKTVVVSKSFIDGIDVNPGRHSFISKLERAGAEILPVTDKVFASLSGTVTPQGIGAVIKRPDSIAPEELPDNASRILVLENVQDPGNVGTCIRTADAFGFDAVICTDNCADVFNPKVIRSTVGSLFHIPVIQFRGGIYKLCAILKARGITVFGADPRGDILSSSGEFGVEKTAVIIGNEANGLTDSARAASDKLVKIPMSGRAESLNAAIAAAVLMYELSRGDNYAQETK